MSEPVNLPSDPQVSRELAREHKINDAEYDRVLERLGRTPSYAELGVISVMWSEHCSYKSSRIHLKRLPTEGPRVIQGPGENAGVVDIGDGFAAVFKMESHNHPSYIEPYQGAATGVGGILRDVFTMGARPIASLNALRFGRAEHPRTPELLAGVVAGVGGYGNCIGVPTVGGELFFDASYDGNCLVNAFTCGVARADRIFYGRASGVDNPVIYVGAKTGRDGIHGATMASDEFSADGPSQRPTVQVGDPFMEKLLLEACLEIFQEDLLVGIQDMGAAGLTSSSVEMAARAGSGLDLDLDRVPRRTARLTPYEMLLSESQERMLLVAKPGKEARVREICEKWELDASVIGRVTDTGRWVVRATPGYDPTADAPVDTNPQVVCDLPVDFLADAAPCYDRPQADDPELEARRAMPELPEITDVEKEILEVIGSPNAGSRRWVYRQYDSIVRGGTIVGPGSDAAVVRVDCERDGKRIDKVLAFACDGPGGEGLLDAHLGGARAVAEVCRNLACAGAEPIGLTDCLNFGNPERPAIMRQFARAIDGMADACRALSVPIVSGNVSLYNETDAVAILPTPTMGGVGLCDSIEDATRSTFSEPDAVVLLLGESSAGPLGGSQWLLRKVGRVCGTPPPIDLEAEARLVRLLVELARARPKPLLSAHDVSIGGLAAALCECCASDDPERPAVGATIRLPDGGHAAEVLFGERSGRVLVSVRSEHVALVLERASALSVPARELGRTGGDELLLSGVVDAKLSALAIRRARDACLDAIVGDEAEADLLASHHA